VNYDPSVIVVTTFPNADVRKKIGAKAFDARVEAALTMANNCKQAHYLLLALCDKMMFRTFCDSGAKLILGTALWIGLGRRQIIGEADLIHEQERGIKQTPVTLWTEEKPGLIQHIPAIVAPIQAGQANIVIPRRKSLASYPTFSQHWEAVGSQVTSMFVGGKPQDYWFGPRALSMAAVRIFLDYPGKQSGLPDEHDSIFCPLIDAAQIGLTIADVEVDFQYSTIQREAEENDAATMNKRMETMRKLFESMQKRKQWLELQRQERCLQQSLRPNRLD
jgi:hypothetical protein